MAHEGLKPGHKGGLTDAPKQYGMKEGLQPAVGRAAVEVGADDLQGHGLVFCPNPKMALWSAHPRVFIDVASTGSGTCPYCGTVYRLRPGETVHGH